MQIAQIQAAPLWIDTGSIGDLKENPNMQVLNNMSESSVEDVGWLSI